MEEFWKDIGRRDFLKRFSVGLTGIGTGMLTMKSSAENLKSIPKLKAKPPKELPDTEVSLVTGTDRRQMIYETLQPFKEDIRKGIAGKKILIKINCNRPDDQLIKTHPDAVRAILDVITPMYDGQIMIGESTAFTNDATTYETYNHFDYFKLEKEYNVKMVELNDDDVTYHWILDRDLIPERIGIINAFLDPNIYLISVTPLKTHDTATTTLSAKNVIMASPLKNPTRGINYKSQMHGQGRKGTPSYSRSAKLLDVNMFKIAHFVQPDLCVLDGLVGAEGEGPNKCQPVDHKIMLAGTDFVAVDRIGSELMGFSWDDLGFLQFCAIGGLGQGNKDKIHILGLDLKDHIIKYKPHSQYWWQKQWNKPIDWGLIHPKG